MATLATFAAAAATTAFSGAFFTSSDASPGSSAGTGNVSIEVEVERQLDTEGLRPGGAARTGTVRLTNNGSLPANLSFDPSGDEAGRLARALRLQVDTVYDGPLGSAPRIRLPGSLDPGDTRTVHLQLSWTWRKTDLSLYGKSIEPTFKWIATSLGAS